MSIRITLVLICLFIFAGRNPLLAQLHDDYSKSAFFTTDGGIYVVPHEHFKNIYGSTFGSVLGAGAGFPLSGRLYMHGLVSYFFKSDDRVEMRMINAGLKYAILVFDDMTVELQGGFVRVDGKRIYPNTGTPPASEEGTFVFGGYAGLGIERKLPHMPVSITGQAFHNVSHKDFLKWGSDFDGIRISIGARYYLPPPGGK